MDIKRMPRTDVIGIRRLSPKILAEFLNKSFNADLNIDDTRMGIGIDVWRV